jgi:uncharacterized membrane protein YdjX (TVP38/TMEM64 family)
MRQQLHRIARRLTSATCRMASAQRKTMRVIVAALALLILWGVMRMSDPREILRQVLERISGLGVWAPFWFILTYIVACLTFFPGVILTLGAGILFGVVRGTLYVSIGATIGAGCAFLLSRYIARDWVIRRFSSFPKFRAIDDAVGRDGWKIVGLIRLSPVFPFIPLNFVFGLTRIPFLHFVAITWLSVIPMSSVFVYLGSVLGNIAALGTEPIAPGRTKWVVGGIAAILTVIVTFFVTRIARRALVETEKQGNSR